MIEKNYYILNGNISRIICNELYLLYMPHHGINKEFILATGCIRETTNDDLLCRGQTSVHDDKLSEVEPCVRVLTRRNLGLI